MDLQINMILMCGLGSPGSDVGSAKDTGPVDSTQVGELLDHERQSVLPSTLLHNGSFFSFARAVRVWLRAAVDAHSDQYGPPPVHRGAAVPLQAHPTARHSSHRCHVAHRSNPLPPCRFLVPRAAHQRRHHLHPRVPNVTHCELFHLLHCARHSPCLPASHGPPRLSLPKNFPETLVDEEPLGCTLRCHQPGEH